MNLCWKAAFVKILSALWRYLIRITGNQLSITQYSVCWITLSSLVHKKTKFDYNLWVHEMSVFHWQFSYHLYFMRISKYWMTLHYESLGVTSKQRMLIMFTYTFLAFFVFHQRIYVFIIFIFIFLLIKSQVSATKY